MNGRLTAVCRLIDSSLLHKFCQFLVAITTSCLSTSPQCHLGLFVLAGRIQFLESHGI